MTDSSPEVEVVSFSIFEAKAIDAKLKAVTRWKDVTPKDAEENGCSLDLLEMKNFRRFRSQIETFLFSIKIKTGSTSAHAFNDEFQDAKDGMILDRLF